MNIDPFTIIELALREDLSSTGDITAQACVPENHRSRATVIARKKGIIAGIEYFTAVFRIVDESTVVKVNRIDCLPIAPGEVVATIEGYTRSLLSAERTALNFLGHLSGIATLTNRLVRQIIDTRAILLDTRKTLPGMRAAEKQAVIAGGGHNHRLGLFDMILIKENHIAAAGGIVQALKSARQYNERLGGKFEIEIEVRNLLELQIAAAMKPDRIMLDNFTPEKVKQAVEIIAGEIPLEVSGGVNESNIREYALAGPDFISMGTITSSAPALDLSMLMEGIEN